MSESAPKAALKGWKSIADHFGRDQSTVMRWAAQRGLPVRRLPGDGRSSVYALPDELAAWLAATPVAEPVSLAVPTIAPGGEVPAPQPTTMPSLARRGALRIAGAGVAVAGIAAVIALNTGRVPVSPAPTTAFHDPAIERAYLDATYDLDLRTPESLNRAVGEFGGIIARDPGAAPAYAALSETYLLLREYSAFPGDDAYRDAAAAAKAAIAINPDLVAAHRALAFIAFWSDHDLATARAEFARARVLDTHNAQTWHWYATALSANGESAAALDAIGEARRLEPQSTPIAADYGLIAYLAGRHAEGLAALHAVAAASPTHMSTHRYLADLALVRGDGATYLDEAAIACRLKADGDENGVMAGDRAAFRAGGTAALLTAIAARLQRKVATGGHYDFARIAALQGRTAVAVAQLQAAATGHEAGIAALPGDLALHGLVGNADFDTMRQRPSLVPARGFSAEL